MIDAEFPSLAREDISPLNDDDRNKECSLCMRQSLVRLVADIGILERRK